MPNTDANRPATRGDIADLNQKFDQKFGQIDQKFGQIGQKFKQIDQKFKQIDQKFKQIDQKFKQIDQKFKQVDQRFDKVDQRFDKVDKTLISLGVEAAKTNLRMDRLENSMMEALRSFKSELLSAFEASVMKGQMYTQKAVTHGDILSAHEEKLLNHENRLTSLEIK